VHVHDLFAAALTIIDMCSPSKASRMRKHLTLFSFHLLSLTYQRPAYMENETLSRDIRIVCSPCPVFLSTISVQIKHRELQKRVHGSLLTHYILFAL